MSLEINWWAVLVATLSSFIIGAVWFGPKTFYPVWMKALGRQIPTGDVQMKNAETVLMFGGTFVGAFVQVTTLSVIIGMARLLNPAVGAVEGLLLGLAFSVGLGAFASLSHRMFGQYDMNPYRALKVWIIEVGQDVVALTVAGAILGAWA